MDEKITAQVVVVENTYDTLMIILREKRFDLAHNAIRNLKEESEKLNQMLEKQEKGKFLIDPRPKKNKN